MRLLAREETGQPRLGQLRDPLKLRQRCPRLRTVTPEHGESPRMRVRIPQNLPSEAILPADLKG